MSQWFLSVRVFTSHLKLALGLVTAQCSSRARPVKTISCASCCRLETCHASSCRASPARCCRRRRHSLLRWAARAPGSLSPHPKPPPSSSTGGKTPGSLSSNSPQSARRRRRSWSRPDCQSPSYHRRRQRRLWPKRSHCRPRGRASSIRAQRLRLEHFRRGSKAAASSSSVSRRTPRSLPTGTPTRPNAHAKPRLLPSLRLQR
mmetsp:Transcript_24349/g.53169  ORF Transcript_24349/g.53169 Transcript_24349/m.53169 type:complete len:203 (+) Transcript_24349:177-785(+)